jgi:tRNA(Ile2) C34 agmatinyltransferase TiaS
MQHKIADCPECNGRMEELEDDWFLCEKCGESCWLEDLPKSSNPRY